MNDECRRCWKAWWNDPMDVGKWEALVEADRKARSEENQSENPIAKTDREPHRENL